MSLNALLESWFRTAPFPSLLLGPNDEILEFNAPFVELTGQRREVLEKRPAFELLTRCGPEGGPGGRARARSRGVAGGAESPLYRLESAAGKRVFLRVYEVPFRWRNRDVRLVILNDETEAVSLRDQNQHLSRLASVGKLLSFVVHEIGNFVTIVRGSAEMIQARGTLDAAAREDAAQIGVEADRISDVIKSFLGFARKDENEIEVLRAADLLDEALKLKKYSLKRRCVTIHVDASAAERCFVRGNRTLLMQVMLNLLDNAEGALQESEVKEIRLALLRQRRRVLIEVADSGRGIAEAEKAKIWDAFYTSRRDGSGTGLGLSICKRIVENHGGELSLLSSQVGKGTVFRIALPGVDVSTAARGADKERQAGG